MMVRERLTGLKPPVGGRAARSTSGAASSRKKPGADLDKLGNAILDQRAFARLVQKLLDVARHRQRRRSRSPTRSRTTTRSRRRRTPENAEGEGEREASRTTRCSARPPTIRPTTPTKGTMDTVEAPSSEFDEEGEAGDAEEAAENRPPHFERRPAPDDRLQGLHHQVRRGRQRRRAVRPGRAATAARLSRQAVAEPFQSVVARLANRLQRRLMAQQNRSWEFDLEEGVLDTRAPDRASSSTRSSRCPSSARRTWTSATPW